LAQKSELARTESALANQPNPLGAKHRNGQEYDTSNRPLAAVIRTLRESEFCAGLMRGGFRLLQRAGVNVTPCHYYLPIPDVRELERRSWPERAFSVPFDLHLDEQLECLRTMAELYRSEWRFPDRPAGPAEYHYNNGFFETVDAEIAYSFVRRYQPARIVEIGAGFSTRVLAAALETNLEKLGVRGELISIDPHLDRAPGPGFSNLVTLVPARVQDLDLELFDTLDRNDILFIDSSHVVGVGSDVVREYLEILPRLQSGVIVHVHDIFLPSDYPRESVLNDLWFWSEQYMLQAFLSFNQSFRVLWASSAMRSFHQSELEEIFPRWATSYRDMPKKNRRFMPSPDKQRVWPSSFWMQRV
jgi:hypothetical protein